jgi:LysR family glycine cleavage system transcriptional activator
MPRYRIPSTSALVAFESAARHGNFSRAADELNTSQPAISRHIKALEDRLGVALFRRDARNPHLTAQGRRLYHAVVAGLDGIHSAVQEIGRQATRDTLTIGCTFDIAHLFIMPRYAALQRALGDDVDIRVLTSEYEHRGRLSDERPDIWFAYRPLSDAGPHTHLIAAEEVFPVAAPGYLAQHLETLSRPPDTWHDVTLLYLSKENQGWATWDTWFEAQDCEAPGGAIKRFSSDVYLLEACVAGEGVALAWREIVGRYLKQGAVVPVSDAVARTANGFFMEVTEPGRGRAVVERAKSVFLPPSA